MFRDEIVELLRDTQPDWMDFARTAHEQDDDVPPANPIEWGEPARDEYAPPSYTEEAFSDTDAVKEAASSTDALNDLLDTGFDPFGGGGGGGGGQAVGEPDADELAALLGNTTSLTGGGGTTDLTGTYVYGTSDPGQGDSGGISDGSLGE